MADDASISLGIDIAQARTRLAELETRFSSMTSEMKAALGDIDFGKLRGDLDALDADLKQGARSAEEVDGAFGRMKGNLAAIGAVVAALGIGQAFRKISEASQQLLADYEKQAQALGQVEAALKSTSGAAGFTVDQLAEMASGLQSISNFGDEEILRTVTANLLTFANVGEESFGLAQKAVLDLATRMGGDLQGATIQIGKALNAPIEGLSALSRVGIQFTADQKALIEQLVEGGRVAEAQGVILAELEKQFGGSAEAAVAAGTGAEQFRNKLGDLREEMGEQLMPIAKELVATMSQLTDEFGDEAVAGITRTAGAVGALVGNAKGVVDGFVPAINVGLKWIDVLDDLGTLWIPKTLAQVVTLGPAVKVLSLAVEGSNDILGAARGIVEGLATSLVGLTDAERENADFSADAAHAAEQLAKGREALAEATNKAAAATRDLAALNQADAEAGGRLAAQIEAEAEARRKLAGAIFGDVEALNERAETLAAVIAREQEHGTIGSEAAKKVAAEVAKLAAEYRAADEALPPYLAKLEADFPQAAEKTKALADETKRLAEATREVAQAGEGAAVTGARGAVADLEAERAALDAKAAAGALSAEESERLADVSWKLGEAQAAQRAALTEATEATEARTEAGGAAVRMTDQEIKSYLELTDSYRDLGFAAGDSRRSLAEFAAETGTARDTSEALGEGISFVGQRTEGMAEAFDKAAPALAGLKANQEAFNAVAGETAEAAKAAGTGIVEAGEAAKEGGGKFKDAAAGAAEGWLTVETIIKRITEVAIPAYIDACERAKKCSDELGE